MAYKPQRPPDFWPRATGDDPNPPTTRTKTANGVVAKGKASAMRWIQGAADPGMPPPGTNMQVFGQQVAENRPAFDGWMDRFGSTDSGFKFMAPPPEPDQPPPPKDKPEMA